MLDNVRADLSRFREGPAKGGGLRAVVRGFASQGFQALLVYRFFNWLHRGGIPSQPFRFFVERLIETTTGISIPANCSIGKGCRIHHFGGIIFHPSAALGENCTIYHGVTVGDRGGYGKAARIGSDVIIGAGAKVIGEVTIGDRCVIGANAVVHESIPDDMTVVGPKSTFRPRGRRTGD